VSALIPPSMRRPVRGSMPSWPDAKIQSPILIACESGTRAGGTLLVCTTLRSIIPPSSLSRTNSRGARGEHPSLVGSFRLDSRLADDVGPAVYFRRNEMSELFRAGYRNLHPLRSQDVLRLRGGHARDNLLVETPDDRPRRTGRRHQPVELLHDK